MKKKVLIVEDDQTMAEMVAYNLRRQDLDAEIAHDGAQGLRTARSKDISLVILDLMLPSLDGLQIASELHTQRPGLPILMLTARSEDVMKIKGFEAGADDYLTKPFSMEELILRVKALLRRAPGSSEEELDEISFGDMRLSKRDQRLWINDEEFSLPAKEFALLSTLASEPGRLLTRIDLGARVWGFENLGDTRTIDTHIKNLRKRLDAKSSFTYIETVRGSGYRFRVRPRLS